MKRSGEFDYRSVYTKHAEIQHRIFVTKIADLTLKKALTA